MSDQEREGFKLDVEPATPKPSMETVLLTLSAAGHALRSYQYGNASPDLAKATADRCDEILAQFGVTR